MEGSKLRKCKQVKIKKINKIKINQEKIKSEKLKEKVNKAFTDEKIKQQAKNTWNQFYEKKYKFFFDGKEIGNIFGEFTGDIGHDFYAGFRNRSSQRSGSFSNYGYKRTEKEYGVILGLQGKVPKLKIRDYWRMELLHWHPDKWINGSEAEKKKAHERTILINEAYKFFKDKYNP
jgi:hypothetical protein